MRIDEICSEGAQRVNANAVKSHAKRYDDVHRDADRDALKNVNKNHIAQYDDDKGAIKKALKSVANKQANYYSLATFKREYYITSAPTRLLVK